MISSNSNEAPLTLIPWPAEIERREGSMIINDRFRVRLSGMLERRLESAVSHLIDRISHLTGIPMFPYQGDIDGEASFLIQVEEISDNGQNSVNDEAYTLKVNSEGALLRANKLLGAQRGIETFLQLIYLGENGYEVPALQIADKPRFSWRGLLIDVVRHWIPMSVIKRNIDAMASVKLNVLHLHLTDDQGFRIESRCFPKLHELGSDGMFYTQEEIHEIVSFAKDRGIGVVPEFDMPGHASSWFVGYPELASSPGAYKVVHTYGGQSAIMDPTREETYQFIKEFLLEMATLFPDPYVHIGGDEVDGQQWLANQDITNFMEREELKDAHDLQNYFNSRVYRILEELDRKMVGWDPILHPDLPKGAVVQSVRGQKWLSDASEYGYLSISNHAYYLTQMHSAGYHYQYDPHGNKESNLEIDSQGQIIGGEASIWTEVSNSENLDSRIWPRTAAIAERLWSPRNVRDVCDMYRRLLIVSEKLALLSVTHISGPKQMVLRLTNYQRIPSLDKLVEVIQPIPSSERRNTITYTMDTPLNRLADAVPPESSRAREFADMVDTFLHDNADKLVYEHIERQLNSWSQNHDQLLPELNGSHALSEIKPLSSLLSKVADIGVESLQAVYKEEYVDKIEREALIDLLALAQKPVAELKLMIVPAVLKLVEASLATDKQPTKNK